MKILLTIMAFVITTMTYAREPIELVYYYPPGGGTDLFSSPLIPELEKQGRSTKKVFFKTCGEAINYVTQNPRNRLIVSSAHDMHPDRNTRCPSLQSSNLKLLTSIASSPVYLCTTPRTSHLGIPDLWGPKTMNIGSTTSDIAWLPINAFIRYNQSPVNARLIPFNSGGELRISATGKDLDYAFVGSDAALLLQQGATCLASSSRHNHLNLPHLGNFVKNFSFPDFEFNIVLWTLSVDAALSTDLEKTLESDTYKEFLKTRSGFQSRHTGNGESAASQLQNLLSQHRALDSVR